MVRIPAKLACLTAFFVAGLAAGPAVGSDAAASHGATKLTPTQVGVFARTAHSVRLVIHRPQPVGHLKEYRIFARLGSKPPGTQTHQPHRKPDLVVPLHHHRRPALQKYVVVRHLHTRRLYTFMVYGVNHHGRVGGQQSFPSNVVATGTHVRGQSIRDRNTISASLVRDPKGGLHLVTLKRIRDSYEARIHYLTKRAGSRQWKSSYAPGKVYVDQPRPQIAAALSTNGKDIDVLLDECGGASTAEVSIHARHLPKPTRVTDGPYCDEDDELTDTLGFSGWTPLPHHEVMLAFDRYGASEQDQTPAVMIGTPGGRFHLAVAPDPGPAAATALDDYDLQQSPNIARDPSTGDITLLGAGNSGLVAWTSTDSGKSWGAPQEIGRGGDLPPIGPAAGGGKVYVGVAFQRTSTGSTGSRFALYTREASGAWSGPTDVPHLTSGHTGSPGSAVLAANTRTGNLHVVYSAVSDNKCGRGCRVGGLRHEPLVGSTWQKVKKLTRWYLDKPAQLVLNKAGHPVVAYDRLE